MHFQEQLQRALAARATVTPHATRRPATPLERQLDDVFQRSRMRPSVTVNLKGL